MRKLIRALPYIAFVGGWVLILSGVSMMEQTAADMQLYPYILRTFAGLGCIGVAAVVWSGREQKKSRH